MKLTHKTYQDLESKNYLKKKSLLFFFSGFNQNAVKTLISEQALKKQNFKFYRASNKMSKKKTAKSIYRTIILLTNTITLLIDLKTTNLDKKNFLCVFKSVFFYMLAVKLNYRIYQTNQFKRSYTFFYNTILYIKFKLKLVHVIKSK